MDGEVFGHAVKREVGGQTVRYRCVECGLGGVGVAEFDQYGCSPQ